MKLREVLEGVSTRNIQGDLDTEILAVTSDSRQCREGSLFVAIPGLVHDGAEFIEGAFDRGAVAVVAEVAAGGNRPSVQVDDAREALAEIAANFYGHPASKLALIGVTGTSGKTTTTKMIESILDATGSPAGLIGTIEYRAAEERMTADRTTPDAVVLQEWLRKMVDAGVRYAVMEVSSHATALRRTHGIPFAAAVFTNLSRDHFDFHENFEDYFAAKRMLFDQIDRGSRSAIVNADDPWGRRLADELGSTAVTFGTGPEADIRPAEGFRNSIEGLRGRVDTPWGAIELQSSLLGTPNLYNWLAAVGAALAVGVPVDQVEQGVRNLQTVRGRFERVPSDAGVVLIDYAHKPDALEKLLHAVRSVSGERRIVVVFGCGGDRDAGKRPLMGEIAGRLADFVILTSDNPRTEDPERILDQIEEGIRMVSSAQYERVSDRRRAIELAVTGAEPGDVVVIAGKGHENYQVVRDEIVHFDDREEAEEALRKKLTKLDM